MADEQRSSRTAGAKAGWSRLRAWPWLLTLSLLGGCCLLSIPLAPALLERFQDHEREVECRLVRLESPEPFRRWITKPPLALKVAFPCDPQADCSYLWLPLANDGEASYEGWGLGATVSPLEAKRLLPSAHDARLEILDGGGSWTVLITGGEFTTRRVQFAFRGEPGEGTAYGDFRIADCLPTTP